jgi:hypothetical protein
MPPQDFDRPFGNVRGFVAQLIRNISRQQHAKCAGLFLATSPLALAC